MPWRHIQAMGKPITVQDEGSPITTDLGSLDFVGAGVSASGDPDVSVNIPGGVSSTITVSGTRDNSNTTFSASTEPTLLVINGAAYQQSGGSYTWSYSGGTIELSSPVGKNGDIYGLE